MSEEKLCYIDKYIDNFTSSSSIFNCAFHYIDTITGNDKLICGSNRNHVYIYDIDNNNYEKLICKNKGGILSIDSFIDTRTNERIILTGNANNYDNNHTINVWNLNYKFNNIMYSMHGHNGYITSLINYYDFNTNTIMIVSGSTDNTIKVWEYENPNSIYTFEGHTDNVNSIGYYRDNDNVFIVSGSCDGTIKIWNTESKENIETLTEHTGSVSTIHICEYDNKNLIISGSRDNTIKIWDANTYECITTINNSHNDIINSIKTYCNDSNKLYIVSTSYDKTIKTWDIDGNCIKNINNDSFNYNLIIYNSLNGKNIINFSDNDLTIYNTNNF